MYGIIRMPDLYIYWIMAIFVDELTIIVILSGYSFMF